MTQLEKDYFNTFTLERLKSLYKKLSKELNYVYDNILNYDSEFHNGRSYKIMKWLQPGGKVVEVKINKRKVRNAIAEREKQNDN